MLARQGRRRQPGLPGPGLDPRFEKAFTSPSTRRARQHPRSATSVLRMRPGSTRGVPARALCQDSPARPAPGFVPVPLAQILAAKGVQNGARFSIHQLERVTRATTLRGCHISSWTSFTRSKTLQLSRRRLRISSSAPPTEPHHQRIEQLAAFEFYTTFCPRPHVAVSSRLPLQTRARVRQSHAGLTLLRSKQDAASSSAPPDAAGARSSNASSCSAGRARIKHHRRFSVHVRRLACVLNFL